MSGALTGGVTYTRGVGSKTRATMAIAVVAALAATPSPARAQAEADKEAARREILAGNQRFGAGDYAGALTHFQAAYARVPSPRIFFNLGHAYRGLGRSAEAADAYRRFLAEATDAPEDRRREARMRLDEVTRAAAAAPIDVPPPPPAPPPPQPATAPAAPRTAFPAPPSAAPPDPASAQAPPGAAAEPAPMLVPAYPLPPAGEPAPLGGADAALTAAPAQPATEAPLYARWWFWAAIGLVAAGVAVAAVASSPGRTTAEVCPDCDLPTVSVPRQ